MNSFYLLSFLSTVFCSGLSYGTPNSSSDTNRNADAGKVYSFVVESLPNLRSLSKLTKYYSRRIDGFPEEELRRYSRFFSDVAVHYHANDNWENTFWGVCNDHTKFYEASLEGVGAAAKAVLAAYGLTVDNDKNVIRFYLQGLYSQLYQEGFRLEEENMFLFLTYLAHQIRAPLRSSTFVVERPRRRLKPKTSAMSSFMRPPSAEVANHPANKMPLVPFPAFFASPTIVDSTFQPQPQVQYSNHNATLYGSYSVYTHSANNNFILNPPSGRFNNANDVTSVENSETEKSETSFITSDSFKSDVISISSSQFEYFFRRKLPLGTIESPNIKRFMEYVKPTFVAVDDTRSSLESIWMNVLNVVVSAMFPGVFYKSVLDATNIILKAHKLELPKSNVTLTANIKVIKPALEDLLGDHQKIPHFKLQNRSCTVLLLAYLAFYAPKATQADNEDTLQPYFLDAATLKKNMIVLNSSIFEEFFRTNASLEAIKSQTIKCFMKYVEPIYNSIGKTTSDSETIWTNVCKVLVARKFFNGNPGLFTTQTAVGTILEDHNLSRPEIYKVRNVREMKTVVESILQTIHGSTPFKVNNCARTFLILSYLAYYSPKVEELEDSVPLPDNNNAEYVSNIADANEEMDVENVAPQDGVKEIELPTTLPNATQLKEDVKDLALNSKRIEDYFERKHSMAGNGNIGYFMKKVLPIYTAFREKKSPDRKKKPSIETVLQKVFKVIVKKKFQAKAAPDEFTIRGAVNIVLEAHGLKCPAIMDRSFSSDIKKIKPVVEPTIVEYVGDTAFKLKNRPLTVLIFSYLAYYAPDTPPPPLNNQI